jgi:hypothetical protein
MACEQAPELHQLAALPVAHDSTTGGIPLHVRAMVDWDLLYGHALVNARKKQSFIRECDF